MSKYAEVYIERVQTPATSSQAIVIVDHHYYRATYRNTIFAQRSIKHPSLPKLLPQILRTTKHTPECHILAEHNRRRIGFHGSLHRRIDGREEIEFRRWTEICVVWFWCLRVVSVVVEMRVIHVG